MLNCSAEKILKSPNSKILITSFLPRQLLINSNINNNNSINMKQLALKKCDSIQQRGLIFQSISQFLEINGFSKTLKNFRKEANIQKDDGGSCSLDIEEVCIEYLKSRNGAKEELGSNEKGVESPKDCEKTKENGDNEGKKSELPTENNDVDVANVKSKKKKSKSANGAFEQVFEETLSKAGENEKKKSEPPIEIGTVDGDGVKSKKKKKNRSDNEASEQVIEETQPKAGENEKKKSEPSTENSTVVDGNDVKSKKKKSKTDNGASEQVIEDTKSKPAVNPEEISLSLPSEPAKKSKDKKKKLKEESEHLDKDKHEKQSNVTENVDKKEKKVKKEKKEKKEKNDKQMEVNVTDSIIPSIVTIEAGEEKKESKKRKKPSSNVNGAGHVEKTAVDEYKRRKTDSSYQSNGEVQPPKTPDVSSNDVLVKDGREKSQKQDKTKELNGSAEPKTVKAFQRVKPEDVIFADERLQDNSYWAKDGADSGYGAKAQEVLGQVRGRDFRHEKTKKKRGSYRGGEIDLNTHSVKFNYEEEDE